MATADEFTLEALLNNATSPLVREDDSDFITLFAQKVDMEFEGPQISTRLLAHKIQSPQQYEALQALVVLEYCMKSCRVDFQNEVGKFRFLNELIKVVSPKYLGEKTSPKVRDKVIQLLYVWSIGLKDQLKIRDAYQMLKQQGIVKQDPEYDDLMLIPTPPPRDEKNNLFRDAERQKRLDKLLKSKNPEDLQAANRLIKSVVMEDQNRMEKVEKRCKILEEVTNNVRLLNEMLAHFDSQETPQTDMETMKELYSGCVKLRPGLFRLASDTDDDEQSLMDILRANDDLSRVMQSYEKLVAPRLVIDRKGDGEEAQKAPEPAKPRSSLIDLAEIEMTSPSSEADDLSNLLGTQASTNGDLFHVDTTPVARMTSTSGDISLLFASASITSQSPGMMSQPTSLMASQPSYMISQQQPLFSQQSAPPKQPTITVPPLLPPPPTANNKGMLSDIDLLSRDLLEKTLGRKPEEKFAPKLMMKPTLNQMSAKPTTTNAQSPQPTDLLDQLLAPTTAPSFPPSQTGTTDQDAFADFMSVPTQTAALPSEMLLPATSPTTIQAPQQQQPLPILPLADILVPLESIKPSTLPPLTVYDNNGIRVLFHFAQEFAVPERNDTLVTVVSIMSTRPALVPHIVLQVAVPKIMRVKLQPPSSTQLAAFNPIVPAPLVTQVMILANPNKKEVKMRFKLDYKLDEQTTVTDTKEITGFPPFEKWGNL